MTCGKTQRELWGVLERANQTLKEEAIGEERPPAGVAYHAAIAAWRPHASAAIAGLSLIRDGAAFRFAMADRGVVKRGLPEDLSTDHLVALAAERIWDEERPRREMNPDTEAVCDAAKVAGLPLLIAEIKRKRDAKAD